MLIRLSCYNKFLLLWICFFIKPSNIFLIQESRAQRVRVCVRARSYVVLLATQKFHFKVCR